MSKKNELFSKDADFSKLVKKAKRKSLIRNGLISVIVSVILFIGLFWLGTFLMYKKMEQESNYDYAWQSIIGANIEYGGSLFNYTPFSATVTTEINKYLADTPVPWGNHEKVFTIFGPSRAIHSHSISGKGEIEDERIPLYFLGERVIEFYHPDGNYEFIPDDKSLLDEIDENKLVELAYSFDTAYTIAEVQEMFGDQLSWYWVDDATPLSQNGAEDQPIIGNNVYGFLHGEESEQRAEFFIRQIESLREEKGDFQQEANRLYDAITDNGQLEPEVQNLKIIGAVVTGAPEQLQQFNELPNIRAAVLGATTDRY